MPEYYRLKRINRRLQNELFGNLLVLMYHRITEFTADPFSTCVTPANFKQHLEVLQSIGEIIPGNQIGYFAKRHLAQGNKFVLTFDDGYQDNFTNALPLMKKGKIPASFFVVVKSDQCFPAYYWDVLQMVFLEQEHLPECFDVTLEDQLITVNLGQDAVYPRERQGNDEDWKIGRSNFPTQRHYWLKYFTLQLKRMASETRENFLESLATATGCGSFLYMDQTASWQDLGKIAESKDYEIGSHSINHRQLSDLSKAEQFYEISESKKRIETHLKQEIKSFAIPHGGRQDFNETTIECIKEAGYQQAYIYGTGPINYQYNPYQIPRINIGNWDKETIKANLSRILNK